MNNRVALPNQLLYEIENLGLPPADKVAFGSQLAAKLSEFQAGDGQRLSQTYEFMLGTCNLLFSVVAMRVGDDVVIIRWTLDSVPLC